MKKLMFKKQSEQEREFAKYDRMQNRARRKYIKSGLIPKTHEGCYVYITCDGRIHGVEYKINGKATIKLLDGTVLAENVDCAEITPTFYAYEDPKTKWTGKLYDGTLLFKGMDDANWHEEFVVCDKKEESIILNYSGKIIARYKHKRWRNACFFDQFFIYKDKEIVIVKDNKGNSIDSKNILWDMIERSRQKDKLETLRELIGDQEIWV